MYGVAGRRGCRDTGAVSGMSNDEQKEQLHLPAHEPEEPVPETSRPGPAHMKNPPLSLSLSLSLPPLSLSLAAR